MSRFHTFEEQIMSTQAKQWLKNLEYLFSAFVKQQTLEEAAVQLALVSLGDGSYHARCLMTFDQGIVAASSGDRSVVDAIHRSSYRPGSTADAAELIGDFRSIYLFVYGDYSDLVQAVGAETKSQ